MLSLIKDNGSYEVTRCDQIYKAYLYLTYNIHNIEKKINCQ